MVDEADLPWSVSQVWRVVTDAHLALPYDITASVRPPVAVTEWRRVGGDQRDADEGTSSYSGFMNGIRDTTRREHPRSEASNTHCSSTPARTHHDATHRRIPLERSFNGA